MSDPMNQQDDQSRNDSTPDSQQPEPQNQEPSTPPPPRKPSEGDGGSRGGDESTPGTNVMWIVGLTVVGIAILAILFSAHEQTRLSYSQLYELIDQGPGGSIETSIGEGQNQRKVILSDLNNLKFNDHEIGGTVTIETLAPPVESGAQDESPEESAPTEPSAEPPPADAEKTEEAAEEDNELIEKEVKFRTGRRGLETHADELFEMATERGFKNISAESSPGTWRSFLPMLIFLGFFLAMFILLLRRVGGAGGAVAFGRSRGKFYAQDDIGNSFDDVAGIDEAVDELREIVDFLSNPDKYRRLGGRIPKGVLLVGPPGTGKTLLAKAVAGEANVPFFSISGSDFVEMFVGVGAARVRDMFQQAIQRAPCIIFIDELDALGKARGSGMVGGHDEREQTLNALLVEMDGFAGNSGVMIMAATNRPEMLDPALLRPGRFDRQVLVDRPDVRGREAILKVHVGSVTLDETVDLGKVAAITSGFCGADLANLVNEAALLAARAGKPTVTMQEFNEGVERVTAGLEKKQRLIHQDEKKRIAYHEAGHALVAHLTHATDPVHKISIIPRGLAALGYTMQRPEGDRYLMTFSELIARIEILVGGTVAEEMIFDDVSTGAQNDLQRATEIAKSVVMDFGMSRLGRVTYRESGRGGFLDTGEEYPAPRMHSEQTAREIDEEVKRIIDEAIDAARELLSTRRETLVDLAERLLEVEVIDNEELREVVGNHADENSDFLAEEEDTPPA